MSDSWNNIKQTVTDTWNNIKKTISDSWTNIKQTATDTVNNIKNTLSNTWNNIRDTVSTVWNSIKSIFSTITRGIYTDVCNWVKNLINSIVNPLSGLCGKIKNALSGVVDAITAPFRQAYNAVSGFVGKINSAFSNLIGKKRSMPIDMDVEYDESQLQNASEQISLLSSRASNISVPDVSAFDIRERYYTPNTTMSESFIRTINGNEKSYNSGFTGRSAISQTPQKNIGETTVTLNIENFNNNREIDIRDLVEEINFYIKQKRI